MNMKYDPCSAREVRILSELADLANGTSPTDLALRTEMERPSLYVLLRRLAKRSYVRCKPDRHKDAPPGAVTYEITAKGHKAREEFAKRAGLKV